jgi:predicted ATP-grasp superfamily ATP-dependent carboligase
MPAAVVCDVAWVNGLATIRTLGRLGVRVVGLDHRKGALGFRSRYCEGRSCPDPVADEAGFVRVLAELGESLDRPAPVFCSHDPYLNAVARNFGALGGRFRSPAPSWPALERIQSKRHQLETATRLGVPTPRFAFEPTDAFGFPVLVKPVDGVGFRRAFRRQSFRCETRAELEEAFARAAAYEPIVQEWIPGGDEELYTLGSYLAQDGEALGLFCGRKLRQTPPGVGTCRVGEAVWVDEVVEQALALLRGLGFHGLSQVELKRDPRDGRFKLMEVNPRLWKWHGLAAACGVDLVRIAYWDLLGARLPPVRQARATRRRWAVTLVGGSAPALVRPPYVDGMLVRDDLKPAAYQVAGIARRSFG